MMRAASAGGLAALAEGDRIVAANREALEVCRERASKIGEAVRCTTSVE